MTTQAAVNCAIDTSEHHEHFVQRVQDCFDSPNLKLTKKYITRMITLSNNHDITLRVFLFAIDKKRMWELFECKSMKEFMQKHLPRNYDTLNRNLVAARIAFKLGGLKMIGQFSDNALQPLNKLSRAQCRRVMKKVKRDFVGTYDRSKVTKKIVENAMYDLGLKTPVNANAKKSQKHVEVLAKEYKRNPKAFIPNIADQLLNALKAQDVNSLIKKLQAGIKNKQDVTSKNFI